MTTWAIVAIPEEGETVWNLSSEKIPHMTLLFLGEQGDADQAIHIATQLQHAVNTSLHKFGVNVRDRGILGEDEADVLFFEQNERLNQLKDFRSHLLNDSVIRSCYDSADQYPSWTPHLTMGYPHNQAKAQPSGMQVHSVYFDKIALWVDNYDGPTFKLDYENLGAMMHDTMAHRKQERASAHVEPTTLRKVVMANVIKRQDQVEPSNLKHHGIGARKVDYKNPIYDALGPTIEAAAYSSAELSREGRFLKHAVSGDLLGNKNKDFKKQYMREHQLMFMDHLKHTIGGTPTERANQRFDICSHPDGDWILSSVDVAAHAGTGETRVRPLTDKYGMIVDYELVADDLSQDDIRYAMMHYGVKGMKWGVRRKNPSGGGSPRQAKRATQKATRKETRATKKTARKEQRKANIKDAIKRPVSADAKTATASRGRIKKHGTDALTNRQLQDTINRLQMEQKYQKLKGDKKSKKARQTGQRYAADILKDVGTNVASAVITDLIKGTMGGGESNFYPSQRVNQTQLEKRRLAIGR